MPDTGRDKDRIGLRDAVAIGIGGMVGGGIFAVLGLAVSFGKGGTPLAFVFAGVIALVTAHSYAGLSRDYPSVGGTVTFLNRAFGKGVFSGGTNNLLWISYIIMLSLYSSAFGSYAANLFPHDWNTALLSHLFLSAVIVVACALNYFSLRWVGRIESAVVMLKMSILALFVILGFWGLHYSAHTAQLGVGHWESIPGLVASGMIIFVAYEGFELIANTAPNIRNPAKNIARAYYWSVGLVILLYVLIAIITVGSLSFAAIDKAKDYALAAAARPFLGDAGYVVISVTAMLSVFSAINATLYGGSRVNYELAEDGEFPHEFTHYFWNQPIGLLVTAVLTLVAANALDLESISTSGSSGFLLIFALVNLANFRLSSGRARRALSLAGCALCLVSLVILLGQQYTHNLAGAVAASGLIAVAYMLEWIYKGVTRGRHGESGAAA